MGPNMLTSNLGCTERAVITIKDGRSDDEITVEEGNRRTAGLKYVELNTNQIMEDGMKRFVVQFNPNTLTLNVKGGGKIKITDPTKIPPIDFTGKPPEIKLEMDLIFDSVENQDAFMADKFVANPTSIVKGAANAVMNADKVYTVRTQVEGFTAAVRNRKTNQVTFTWGKLNYKGTLTSLDSVYTMFNPDGEPIRANASLKICCLSKELLTNVGEWIQRYNETFLGEEMSGSGVHMAQKAGNLLNLPF